VPSQLPTGVNVESVHEAAPHDFDVGWFWHAPEPSHLPVCPQGGAGAQAPCGSGSPAFTSVQRPSLPGTAHERQVAQLAVAQQTPSVQKSPVKQSALTPHGCPRRFLFPQALVWASQMAGATQSASEVQAELQLAPLQA